MKCAPNVGAAIQAMLALSPEERSRVLVWFCDGCLIHVGPGAKHRCSMGSTCKVCRAKLVGHQGDCERTEVTE